MYVCIHIYIYIYIFTYTCTPITLMIHIMYNHKHELYAHIKLMEHTISHVIQTRTHDLGITLCYMCICTYSCIQSYIQSFIYACTNYHILSLSLCSHSLTGSEQPE